MYVSWRSVAVESNQQSVYVSTNNRTGPVEPVGVGHADSIAASGWVFVVLCEFWHSVIPQFRCYIHDGALIVTKFFADYSRYFLLRLVCAVCFNLNLCFVAKYVFHWPFSERQGVVEVVRLLTRIVFHRLFLGRIRSAIQQLHLIDYNLGGVVLLPVFLPVPRPEFAFDVDLGTLADVLGDDPRQLLERKFFLRQTANAEHG